MNMRYTLITKLGKVMVFHIKAVAENYQLIYGGTIIDQTALQMEMESV
jgi:hypothetical protein